MANGRQKSMEYVGTEELDAARKKRQQEEEARAIFEAKYKQENPVSNRLELTEALETVKSAPMMQQAPDEAIKNAKAIAMRQASGNSAEADLRKKVENLQAYYAQMLDGVTKDSKAYNNIMADYQLKMQQLKQQMGLK